MTPPTGDSDNRDGNGRDAFLRQLPKRIAAIEEIWSRLENGNWDPSALESLYGRIQEISESSKDFSLFQLNESVFSLEVYLSSYVGSDIVPDASQISAIAGLVRALNTAANITASTEVELEGGSGDAAIFVLGDEDGPVGEIVAALRTQGCDVHVHQDTQALLNRLQAHPPKVIVADTSMLPSMGPLSDELIRLRSHMSIDIPLIFISRSTALQLRVDAIRAGGDGYLVAPLDAAAVATRIRGMASPTPEQPFRVLLVEDDPTQADFAASIMRKAGIEVVQVTEPVKVIESLREFHPDLILMDIYMPEVNGIELTTIIRDHQEFVAIPIVFLSGEQNTDKQLAALSVGGDDFVAKPIRPKHLLGVVQTRIRRARQLLAVTGQRPKHDRVTGLFSRQHFLDRVGGAIDDELRSSPTAVLFVQPGGFDQLLPRIGVGGIDHLMSELGTVIATQLRETDVAARLDDHSFGVLARRESEQALAELAERIRDQIAGQVPESAAHGGACIGMCLIDDHIENANGAIARSRSACQEAEPAGGLRIHEPVAQADEQSPQPVDDDLPQRVKAAIRDDAFVIQYQPLLDLQTRGSENYEVVLRLENASGDLIGGQAMLEAADSAGVRTELDEWILERGLNILKQRRESGRRTRIFVHQSAPSAMNVDMPAWLLGRLRARQMVGSGLVIDYSLRIFLRILRWPSRTSAPCARWTSRCRCRASLKRMPRSRCCGSCRPTTSTSPRAC